MKLFNVKDAIDKYKTSVVFLAILYVILGAVLYFSAMENIRPVTLDVKLLSIAEQTITSPTTVVDSEATEARKEEAVSQVEDVFIYSEELSEQRVEIVNSVFEVVLEVKEAYENNSDEEEVSPKDILKKIKAEMPTIKDILSDEEMMILYEASKGELEIAKNSTVTAVHNTMSGHLTTSQVNEAREQIAQDLSFANVGNDVREVIQSLGKYAIVANYFFDSEATEDQRELAREAVDTVTILQGQVLIKEGETITREIYQQLTLVGLVDNPASYQPYIGLLLIVLLLLFFVFLQSRAAGLIEKEKRFSFSVYVIIIAITVGLMKGVSLFQPNYSNIGYLVPVAMGTMLVYLVLHPRLVYPTGLIFAVIGSIIFNEGVTETINFSVGIYYLFSSFSVLLFLQTRKRNMMLLRVGMFISLINMITIAAMLLLKNGQYTPIEIVIYVLLAIGSGMLSSILAIGFLPYLEDGFGMISHMKLMELSSPNHPLLRRILLKAPGTYHHSIMVANLSEAACEAIGANGLVARVGAYYHDIGKTEHPHYFIENQMGMRNPHDDLTPEESKEIILAHVTDGLEILRKHRMPKEIVDICAQHHGTTLLKYFYVKAKEDNDSVLEDDYRYPGPIPRTKEATVVGIADSVEAAVRSLTPPTPENIEKLISGIVNDRLQDGQFGNCDLTIKELQIVQRSLYETLIGTFHSRIKYPELKK